MSILALVCILMLFSMWIIASKSDKFEQSHENYFFANRNVSSLFLAGTIVATQVGGGSIVGVTDDAFAIGWWALIYPASQTLGLILIALFYTETLQSMKLSTVSEIFTRYYHSEALRKIASNLSALSLFFILVAQGVATKHLLISIGFSEMWLFGVVWLTVVTYTALGGFSVVVKTDLIQVAFIVISLLAMLYYLHDIPSGHKALTVNTRDVTDWFRLANIFTWATAYMFIEQDMIQRFVSAKSTPILKSALWTSVIALMAIGCLPAFIGTTAHDIGINLSSASSSVLVQTALTYTPKWVYLLVSFGILMAILSTVDSLMSAISSLLVIDRTYQKNHNPVLITAIIGVSALLLASVTDEIINTLVSAYALTSSALFVPVFCVINQKPISQKSAWSAVIAGIASYILLYIFYSKLTFLALAISGAAAAITQLIEKR